ncbi:gluconokinase [Pullulanibacillus pueri]|uniref:Gluconate kinase n=1 Tax=Pullulanibacillus pueri TaxID=1437324 RepID=A0A8J2ZX77_9BACL|nr:FGGY family carbohydrate kinase [Pullulanibacillus pueri]MBM7681769.1 gluconokinase [Pullulanibacillus pueri]GGH84188.1 gluconate kinase [Pullulanibacillus pueri]
MNQKDIVVAVDIGTTSTKSAAFDPTGHIYAESAQEYPLYSEVASRAEQDPEEIFQAIMKTLSDVVASMGEARARIAAVSFSSAMHSLIALDREGTPLTRSMTWADQRASLHAEQLKATAVGQGIYQRTGTPIHPMSPLVKLLWFKDEDQETYQKAAKWVGIKEYAFFRLFGTYVVDYSIASATGLFNLHTCDWDAEALALTGVPKEKLPEPVPTTQVIQGLNKADAEQLGLPADLPFVVGASDGVLANLGVGAIAPGTVACSIGTSGAVRTVVNAPTTDPKGRLFCYALTEDQWVIGGPINNGGVAFRWARDHIFPDLKAGSEDPYEYLTQLASEIDPGSEGLLFLPYLTGERAPLWNADTKGVFFGLTLNHDRRHMIRAVMEGVMFQMHAVVAALKETGVDPQAFRVTGGFTKSLLWRQIMADIFERGIHVPETPQGSSFGAALLAMKALGILNDFSTVEEIVAIGHRHTPNDEASQVYRKLKPIFMDLAEKLTPDFKALSAVQRDLGQKQ